MAPFILDKALEPDGDGFVLRFTKDEIEAMAVEPGTRVQVHLTAPFADLERIGEPLEKLW